MDKVKRERRGITYERFTRGLYEIFFFFFHPEKEPELLRTTRSG